MRTTLTVLAVVLVAQLALAAALNWGGSESSAIAHGPLLTFDTNAVDAIRIADSEGNTLLIERTDDGWKLPGADGFAASPAKVERLLSNAHAFPDRLPVARSEASWQRFSVASDKFERRIRFIVDGETRATLFVGESAGAGQVYVRAKGQNMLYEVDFALHYAATSAEDWLDHSVVNVRADQVRKIILPEFTLTRADDESGWKLARGGGKPEAWAKTDAVDDLLRQLARPDFEDVAKAEASQGKPKFAYTLVLKDGNKAHFAYYGAGQDGDQPRLYRKGQPWVYRVTGSQLDKLTGLKAKQFVAEDRKDKSGSDSATDSKSTAHEDTGQNGQSSPAANAGGKAAASTPTAPPDGKQVPTSGETSAGGRESANSK